jgi:NADH-quinone oxidoreductase subunit H
MFHALADGAKMAFKEDFVPANADRMLHALGPIIALFPAFVVFGVVPFGDTLCIHVNHTGHFFTDLFTARIGEISNGYSPSAPRYGSAPGAPCRCRWQTSTSAFWHMFAMAVQRSSARPSPLVIRQQFSLLGGLRLEPDGKLRGAMGLSLVGAFMTYNSVRFDDMVRWQSEHAWGSSCSPSPFSLLAASIAEEQGASRSDAPEERAKSLLAITSVLRYEVRDVHASGG